jgi:hypothetical protein
VHRFKLGGLELDAEARFDGYDQVDVVERVPLRNVRSREAGAEFDGIVIKEVVKDGREPLVNIVLLHQHIISMRAADFVESSLTVPAQSIIRPGSTFDAVLRGLCGIDPVLRQ